MSGMDSHRSPALQAGTPAPDFTLHTKPDQSVSLSQFRGNPTILAFYPADFSPVCGDQMAQERTFLSKSLTHQTLFHS
jgi:peroxiredoxin